MLSFAGFSLEVSQPASTVDTFCQFCAALQDHKSQASLLPKTSAALRGSGTVTLKIPESPPKLSYLAAPPREKEKVKLAA